VFKTTSNPFGDDDDDDDGVIIGGANSIFPSSRALADMRLDQQQQPHQPHQPHQPQQQVAAEDPSGTAVSLSEAGENSEAAAHGSARDVSAVDGDPIIDDPMRHESAMYRHAIDSAAPITAEWNDHFSGEEYAFSLKNKALTCSLTCSHTLSICWRVFLGVLPLDTNEWPATLCESRRAYEELCKVHVTDPRARAAQSGEAAAVVDDPLSEREDSVWREFFKDEELRELIRRDVDRTYPEYAFFRMPAVQDLLVNLLFLYSKLNPDVSYRQGMHELLAPCVFLLSREYFGGPYGCPAAPPGDMPELLSSLLDGTFLAHDAYTLFSRIMMCAKDWYRVETSIPTSLPQRSSLFSNAAIPTTDLDAALRAAQSAGSLSALDEPKSAIMKRINSIHGVLLREMDYGLFERLNKLGVEPQLYGLRWVRLLVGREFHLHDVLRIWTAIFADSPSLSFIDYVCVAMLMHIREQLMALDYSGALRRLMKYPPVEDVSLIVQHALALRTPTQLPSSPSLGRSSSTQSGIADLVSVSPDGLGQCKWRYRRCVGRGRGGRMMRVVMSEDACGGRAHTVALQLSS
jgi:hypothetical protein